MDKVKLTKESLFRTIQEVVKEISSTGGNSTAGATAMPGPGEQTFTSKAFKKKVKESNTSAPFGKNFKHSTHPEAKAMDYKELWEGKFQIGTDTKTDSGIFFEPETGAFYINVIDGAGNRTSKLQVNTIDDVLAKFPNWKWTEKGKAEFGNNLDELTANDPVLMAMRAKKDAPKPQVQKTNPNQAKINMLLKKRAEIERDMEQEAEPEGGPVADKYGDMLNRIDQALAKLKENVAGVVQKKTLDQDAWDEIVGHKSHGIEEGLQEDDRVKVVYGNEFYGETGTIVARHGGFVEVEMDRDGEVYSMHTSDVERIEDEEDEGWEDDLMEATVPENIKKFAKRKGVSSLVNKVASWAEKVGARITGGTAIGKNYDTLVLDLGYQTSDIYINTYEGTIELYGEPVESFPEFKQVFMDRVTKDQMDHDEHQYSQETGLEEAAGTDEVVATLNNPNLDPDVKKTLMSAYRQGHITAEGVMEIVKLVLKKGSLSEAKQEWAIKNIEALINDYAAGKNLTFKPVDKQQIVNKYGSKRTIYIYKLGDKDLIMVDDKAAGAPRLNDFIVAIGTREPGTTSLKNSLSLSKFGAWGTSDILKMLDKAFGEKPSTEEALQENYSKFKTETKTRGKSEQFHQAIREVRKKVQEINRLFEYVSRLKGELSEGEGGLKYKIHTERALSKIKEMVSELNRTIKKFK